MKKIYLIVTIEENGLYYSYVIQHNSGNNLLSQFQRIRNAQNVTMADTKKAAFEICRAWNESYKLNGTNMFFQPDSPFTPGEAESA